MVQRFNDQQLSGFDELNRALKQLAPRKQRNAIRNAARAAVQPTKRRAEALVPRGTRAHRTYRGRLVAPGFASRNINVNTKASRDGSLIDATVGTRKEAFYVRQFLEVGTKYVDEQRWLRPAYEATRGTMVNLFKQQLREKIIAQAKKVKKPRRVRR